MPQIPPVLPPGALGGPQPVIRVDDELTLRPFVASDVDVLVAAYADPGIQLWHRRSLTPAEALEWVVGRAQARWAAETGIEWAVVDADGTVVGRVGLPVLSLREGHAEAGYWVLPEARGRGVAGRALTAVADWVFGLGLPRVELRHSVLNEASCRVATKAGFVHEGTARKGLVHADGFHDMHLHARLAPGA